MTGQHLNVSRARHALVAFALVGGTMAAVAGTSQSASADSSDQLVVVDVTSADSGAFSASALKTVNVDGTKSFVKPVDLPVADASPVNAFALAGDSNGNGSLARSVDGSYLAVAGYHHTPGATGQVKGTTAVKPKDTKTADSADGPGVQRMVARIGSGGAVDTSTLLGTSMDKSHPRGVATNNGLSFYLSGNNSSTDTGIFTVPLGGGAKTPIAGSVVASPAEPTGDQANTRNIDLTSGDLFTISEKANLAGLGKVGTGAPTTKSTITRLGPKALTLPIPTSLVTLDANSGVAGVDTAYVTVDTDDNGSNDEIRKYVNDGSSWTINGTKPGDYPFLTGRVSGGEVQLFASKGSGVNNTVVKFKDTTPTAGATFTADSDPLATAATNHAFRGIALAPTGWHPPVIDTDLPTASVSDSKVGGTIGDAHNPGTTLTLADDDTDPADLTVVGHSDDTAVIPDSGIHITGSGLERTVTFTPAGKGRANITFTVTDDADNHGIAQLGYAASSAPTSASGRYLYESSDLSSAVDVGDGHILAASSEDNKIRLYAAGQSGRPVKTFDFDGDIGATNADIESMARVGDVLYILGSHGNNSSGDPKPSRRVLFTAAISGSGADTTLTFVGKDNGLWDALRTWDQANGNRLGFAAGQASGVPANNTNGFNIEGFELAPGSTDTGYLAFRAPLVTHDGKPSAVIVPVKNLSPIMTGTLAFDDPIYLDLGGRTIREIRKNADDEYLISASKFDAGSPQWKLYAWDGNPENKPIDVKNLPDPDATRTGSWESIVSVPSSLSDGGKSVTLVSDSGDTTYYGDSIAGADESKGFRKSYIDEFSVSSFTDYPDAPANVTATPARAASMSAGTPSPAPRRTS